MYYTIHTYIHTLMQRTTKRADVSKDAKSFVLSVSSKIKYIAIVLYGVCMYNSSLYACTWQVNVKIKRNHIHVSYVT